MKSSREDDPEKKAVALLHQIRLSLEVQDESESAEARVIRLERVLRTASDILTLYGANIFTLAVHQVQIIQQLTEVEEHLRAKMSGKMPDLPHFRHRVAWDDIN
jgi:hypothetical protein